MIGKKIATRSQEYAESIINTIREPLRINTRTFAKDISQFIKG